MDKVARGPMRTCAAALIKENSAWVRRGNPGNENAMAESTAPVVEVQSR